MGLFYNSGMKKRRDHGSIQHYTTKYMGDRWRASIAVPGGRKTLGSFLSRDEAEKALRKAQEKSLVEDGIIPPTAITIKTWANVWLQRRVEMGRHRPGRKLELPPRIAYASIADKPLVELTRKDIKSWLHEVSGVTTRYGSRPARSTLLNSLNLLRVLLADAVDDELIPINPALGVKVPKMRSIKEAFQVLTVEEVKNILSAPCLKPSNRNALQFAAFTGVRAGELAGLRWENISWETNTVSIQYSYDGPTKSGQPRQLPLFGPAKDALLAQRAISTSEKYVFPGRSGSPFHCGHLLQLRQAAQEVGIEKRVWLHLLRHSFASWLVSGVLGRSFTLYEVSKLLGHSAPATSNIYAKFLPGNVFDAVKNLDVKF